MISNTPPLLLLDIGNTRAKGALARWGDTVGGGALQLVPLNPPEGLTHDTLEAALGQIEPRPVRALVAASGPEEPWIEALGGMEVHRVRPTEGPLPFNYQYRTDRLGADRLAALAWASGQLVAGSLPACLVILAGTCVTLDALEGAGGLPRHRGGSISPGLNMRMLAMHTGTAGLPDVPLPPYAIGAEALRGGLDTAGCMIAGGLGGVSLEIQSRVEAWARELDAPQLTVYLSGGDGPRLLDALKDLAPAAGSGVQIHYLGVDDLVLHGMGVLSQAWELLGPRMFGAQESGGAGLPYRAPISERQGPGV